MSPSLGFPRTPRGHRDEPRHHHHHPMRDVEPRHPRPEKRHVKPGHASLCRRSRSPAIGTRPPVKPATGGRVFKPDAHSTIASVEGHVLARKCGHQTAVDIPVASDPPEAAEKTNQSEDHRNRDAANSNAIHSLRRFRCRLHREMLRLAATDPLRLPQGGPPRRALPGCRIKCFDKRSARTALLVRAGNTRRSIEKLMSIVTELRVICTLDPDPVCMCG